MVQDWTKSKCRTGLLACGNLQLLVPAPSTGAFKSQKSFQVALAAVLKIFWDKLGIAMHWIQTAHCQSDLLKSFLLRVKDKLNELLLPVWIFSTCHWNQHRIAGKKMHYSIWGERNKASFFKLSINICMCPWNLRDHVQETPRLKTSVELQTFIRESITGKNI